MFDTHCQYELPQQPYRKVYASRLGGKATTRATKYTRSPPHSSLPPYFNASRADGKAASRTN